MKLVVAIHDVSPANESGVRTLWRMSRERGVTPALFVVPNWHGDWPLRRFPQFTTWIRQCIDEGADAFLHGERHDEIGSTRSLRDHLRALGRTDAEAEFLSLEVEQARARIARGLDVLHACGVDPIGFVPPAWLGRPGWPSTMNSFGFRVSEDDAHVYLHERGTRIEAPVTRWSARTRLRASVSALVAELRWRGDPRARLMRVALHPSDLASRAVRESIASTLDHWCTSHLPFRYCQL